MEAVINDIKLAYEVLGHEGIPLVLIHGFGLNRSIWRQMVLKHIPKQHVILPDVRGHGESEAPSGIYSMEALAEDLAGLLDFLQVDKAIICGHSMGGYISLAFADLYPQRLAGLGLITSHAKADSEVKKKSRYELIDRIRKGGSVELAKSLAPKLSKNEAIIKETYKLIEGTSPNGIIGVSGAMAERVDRSDLLTQLVEPILLAAGEEDQLINFAEAQALMGALPNGKFYAIPDAGHMPMWENPGALAEGIWGLIKRVG